jgi:hypothetical protein
MLLTLRPAGCQSVPAVKRPSQAVSRKAKADNEKQFQTATKPFLAPPLEVDAKAAFRRIDCFFALD